MPPVAGEKRGAARPSKPLSKGVSKCLRDICSIFLSCSANEAEKEKVYKDSQVDRDEDAESEDCPQDGLPITIGKANVTNKRGKCKRKTSFSHHFFL